MPGSRSRSANIVDLAAARRALSTDSELADDLSFAVLMAGLATRGKMPLREAHAKTIACLSRHATSPGLGVATGLAGDMTRARLPDIAS